MGEPVSPPNRPSTRPSGGLSMQRNIMPSCLLPIYLPIAIVLSLMGVFGILKNLYFVMPMVCYQFCMILCVSGILARRQTDNSEKLRRGERICFGAMLVGAPAFHLTALLMSTGTQEADLILIGTTGLPERLCLCKLSPYVHILLISTRKGALINPCNECVI